MNKFDKAVLRMTCVVVFLLACMLLVQKTKAVYLDLTHTKRQYWSFYTDDETTFDGGTLPPIITKPPWEGKI